CCPVFTMRNRILNPAGPSMPKPKPRNEPPSSVAVSADNAPAPADSPAAAALPARPLDNKTIAAIFYETADLMEINGDDSFRIRSYRRAAEAIEGLSQQVSDLIGEPKKLLEIPGIGKG